MGISPRPRPLLVRLAPFFLSAFFFTSAIFTLFSALPLMLSFVSAKRSQRFIAVLSNALIVFFLTRWTESASVSAVWAAVYLAYVALPACLVVEALLYWRWSPERAFMGGFLTVLTTLGLIAALAYWKTASNPFQTLAELFGRAVDMQVQMDPTSGADWPISPKVLKDSFLRQTLPVVVMLSSFLFVWTNLLLLLRINPQAIRSRIGLSQSIFVNWKGPEHLVWPTLLVIALFVFVQNPALQVPVRVALVFFGMVYAVQGLSIVACYLQHWQVWPILRPAFYMLTILFVPYFLSILGFFDLWFDFRARTRQTEPPTAKTPSGGQ